MRLLVPEHLMSLKRGEKEKKKQKNNIVPVLFFNQNSKSNK
jgi:hypothetical protein